jgi:alcohol dehydrogenase
VTAPPAPAVESVLRDSPVQVAFGAGTLDQLGELARSEGGSRVLLVTDPAIRAAGHVDRAIRSLREGTGWRPVPQTGFEVIVFDGVTPNPTTETVDAGLRVARDQSIDLVIGLGGGSAMDCAKAINLLLTNGGRMQDYHGDPPLEVLAKRRPLLPMILIPTTAGTGSEAQSFALIAEAATHEKMACGDRRPPREGGLRPRLAILDPSLTRTMPPAVAAASGIDAVSHAIETAGCRARNDASRRASRAAWELLSRSFEPALRGESDAAAGAEMLLGAHLAGCAIERAMLGAAHACANPLTARFGITHGVAVGVMLPHVIRFNAGLSPSEGAPASDAAAQGNPYSGLCDSAEELASTVERMLNVAGLPRTLRALGVPAAALAELAELASGQWTAGFNPRPVDARACLSLYERAFG